jgi:AcrR family transcriptional regulator
MDRTVSRWEPNARGRLEEAALELFEERGFGEVTVAEIAASASLAERTFFRHFADKREVLFWGQAELIAHLRQVLADSLDKKSPIDAVLAAIEAGAEALPDRREFARRRRAVIAANIELQEREALKLASMTSAISTTLVERGVDVTDARLAAEAGVGVFKVAYDRWIAAADGREFRPLVRRTFADLRTLMAAPASG